MFGIGAVANLLTARCASEPVQAWQVEHQKAHESFHQGSALLAKVRGQGQQINSPILLAAARKHGATATLRYLEGEIAPLPEVPRQLSDSILKLNSASKRAHVALNQAQTVFEDLETWADRHGACFAVRPPPEVSDAAATPPGQPAQQCEGEEREEQRISQHVAWLEAVLLLGQCVEGMKRESMVLEAAAATLHLEMNTEEAESIGEMLSLNPFMHEDVVEALSVGLGSGEVATVK